ncbi:hypothetical protein [Bdellovibrio sp.]|uniref:hypothetical protein n=1 Tax=Bdellovibrio sp. TaxID=28201 RepID=UPI003221C8FA
MGYFARKSPKTTFRIVEEVWTPNRKEAVVPREAYAALGFRFDMTFEEAHARAKQLNLQNKLESKKVIASAKRIADEKETTSAYLPSHLVNEFEKDLRSKYDGNEERLNNVEKQWVIVKKMITSLALDPKKFCDEKEKFYKYYRDKAWGKDYIKKLTWMVNLWLSFYARKTQSFMLPLPPTPQTVLKEINKKRSKLPGKKKAADALKWIDLKNKKSTFEHENLLLQWNWMYIGMWFGLRPKEIDRLKDVSTWTIEFDSEKKIEVLSVFQEKLLLDDEDCWKPIPVYFPEQRKALELIKSAEFKRPLNKTLKRIFAPDKIESYSPRKGFTDLFLEKGFKLEDVSTFLGHQDISTTWKHYKNKKQFSLPKKAG